MALYKENGTAMATFVFDSNRPPQKGWGVLTPWTLLMKAGDKNQSDLEKLLQIYQEPVYAYYRAEGLPPQDAEDLTQSLLMDFFLVKGSQKKAEQERGRFRNYLLAAARHALLDWKKKGTAKRRGGKKRQFSLDMMKDARVHWEPEGGTTPNEEYERHWALATWRAAMEIFRTRQEPHLVEALDLFYGNEKNMTQQEAARQLGISVAAFNSRLYTARRRLFSCIREILHPTVEEEGDLDEELDQLREGLSKGVL